MYGSWSEAAIVCAVVFPLLAITATALRLWSRKVSVAKFGLDDYLVVVALAFITTKACLVIYGACEAGIGQAPSSMSMQDAAKMSKYLWFDILFVHLSIGIVKISVLLFYKRIFATPRFNLWANATLILATLWTAAATLTHLFGTLPISNWWNKGPSININTYLIIFAALDIFLDVLILGLPVPIIAALNMDWRKKVTIVGLFWLGVFCTAAAAVRLYLAVRWETATQPTDSESLYLSVNSIIWCLLEPCVCIITACLPTLGPLLQKQSLLSLASTLRSYVWRKSKTVSSGTQTSDSSTSGVLGQKGMGLQRVAVKPQVVTQERQYFSFDFDLERGDSRESNNTEARDLATYRGVVENDYARRAPSEDGCIRVERSFVSMSEVRRPEVPDTPPKLPSLRDLEANR